MENDPKVVAKRTFGVDQKHTQIRRQVEKALGHRLPLMAPVHETCGTFVVCQDQAYHMLLHQRERALKVCGHANWKKCGKCSTYKDPQGMRQYQGPCNDMRYYCLVCEDTPQYQECLLKCRESCRRHYYAHPEQQKQRARDRKIARSKQRRDKGSSN